MSSNYDNAGLLLKQHKLNFSTSILHTTKNKKGKSWEESREKKEAQSKANEAMVLDVQKNLKLQNMLVQIKNVDKTFSLEKVNLE